MVTQNSDSIATPGRIRTYDKKIKSLLLYQLSYGGVVLAGRDTIRERTQRKQFLSLGVDTLWVEGMNDPCR